MKNLFKIFLLAGILSANTCWADYVPQNNGIMCVNGKNRFTRAIYGTNSPFRFETSDFPEIGLYMPHMGGSVYFAIQNGEKVKWISKAELVEATYKAGSRKYVISDKEITDEGRLVMEMLAWADADGVIVKLEADNLPQGFRLLSFIGGATDEHFRREGDMGADRFDCFYIKPENCKNNVFQLNKNTYFLNYGNKQSKQLYGVMPQGSVLEIVDADYIREDLKGLIGSAPDKEKPLLKVVSEIHGTEYMGIVNPLTTPLDAARNLSAHFALADAFRNEVAGKVKLQTPDQYLNPVGGNLAMAADAVWQAPTYLHGAIGWRMPLLGWRHCYIGDFLGWRERSRSHFDYYADLQLTKMPDKPVTMDEAQRFARSKYVLGTPMYSSGYIANCQDNALYFYDMNLVYIDALLWHINWTGDLEYARKMWPVIERHLAWEKRTFDANNDGLYDAVCCIWASDALQYSGGNVTHSSAYNYRANKMAAIIAEKIGEDGSKYKKEAALIKKAIDETLWIGEKGWWAEYQGNIKNTELHESAAAWTFYHSIDSELSEDNIQGYQAARYAMTGLPHMPVINPENGQPEYSVVSTTNWMPYEWSVNNVALAESAHTALALFQAGMNEEAYKLMKGAVIDVMYKGKSPGNFGMTTSYDIVGEVYRDFSDGVGIFGRLLVQGLFGINPDALNGNIYFIPGFPKEWDNASIETSDIAFSFERKGLKDKYIVTQKMYNTLKPILKITALYDKVKEVKVNGKKVKGRFVSYVGKPVYEVPCSVNRESVIEIEWAGKAIAPADYEPVAARGGMMKVELNKEQTLIGITDPQGVLSGVKSDKKSFFGTVAGVNGHRTMFAEVKQGDAVWKMPIEVEVRDALEILPSEEYADKIGFRFRNNGDKDIDLAYTVNGNQAGKCVVKAHSLSDELTVEADRAFMGTNKIGAELTDGTKVEGKVVNWNLRNSNEVKYNRIDISSAFNEKVSNIFKNKYLSPRWQYTTLQQPIHGFGDWCVPNRDPKIAEVCFGGKLTGGVLDTSVGVPFNTNEGVETNNIMFTSLWDNFPDSIAVDVEGKARHAYLLMAGSTNHMQSRFVNGVVSVVYKDGTSDELELKNPDTWVPIEQDFYLDEYAYKVDTPKPYRVLLNDGRCSRNLTKDLGLKMKAKRMIEGGAAVLLDLPLDAEKEIDKLVLKTTAYEVIIGLMGITLVN